MLGKARKSRVSFSIMSSLSPANTATETKPVAHPPRRLHSVEKKRRIVEETLQPHASVARVAQAHGVNANQVFYWRKQYQQGLLGTAPSPAALLPVQISDPVCSESVLSLGTRSEPSVPALPREETVLTGTIHLELAQAKLCIQGAADPSCLRMVLDRLLG
jgi:transposase